MPRLVRVASRQLQGKLIWAGGKWGGRHQTAKISTHQLKNERGEDHDPTGCASSPKTDEV